MIARRVWRAVLTLTLILAAVFAVGAPPERCPSVTTDELRGSAQASVDWFVRNQDGDGRWLYLYNADEDSTPSDYNEVRHAGVTMGLYQAAAARLPGASLSGDRGLEWALERLIERDEWAALAYEGEVNTGATALLAAGLDHPPRGHRRHPATTACCAGSGASWTPRPSPRVPCSPPMTRRPMRRIPASTRSTTRARPTGPSPAFTGPSPARAGTRRPTASAAIWRARATRPRITGRRSPITGPPTARPKPWSSPSAAATPSPRTRWTTRAGRPDPSAPRLGWSPSASGPGARWCGTTRPAAAATAWSARP